MLRSCPGSRTLAEPLPETFHCACGEELEIWTDESHGTCARCGATTWRDPGTSCLQWCDKARECVGDEVFEDYERNVRRAAGDRS